MVKPFLTAKQLKVLELKAQGYSIEEIAEIIGTTRTNVSIMLRRAKVNVQRARETLKLFICLNAPLKMRFSKGVNLFDVIAEVYKKADEHRIRIKYGTATLLRIIKESLKTRVDVAEVDFSVYVSEDGDVTVERC